MWLLDEWVQCNSLALFSGGPLTSSTSISSACHSEVASPEPAGLSLAAAPAVTSSSPSSSLSYEIKEAERGGAAGRRDGKHRQWRWDGRVG